MLVTALTPQRLIAYGIVAIGAVLMLGPFYFMFVFATHTNREILSYGSAANNSVQARGGTTGIRKRTGANTANGASDHTGQVRPYLSTRDNASVDQLHTDIEKPSLTWGSASGTTPSATFCSSADAGISADFLYLAVWAGGVTPAAMTDTERSNLLSALGWAVTGY